MTGRSTLKIRKPAQKRSTYIERTRQSSRAAQSLLAAANGHDGHWSHDDIRTALLRRHAVELDDLLAELPRPAITHAVTKGWIHRTAGEPCFRVTSRAAAELKLPARHDGKKIAFADLAKLPKSLPAFDEPKPAPKPVVTEERGAALLAELLEPRPPLEQARLYHAVMAETGWKPIEIARRLHQDPVEISRRSDDVFSTSTYWNSNSSTRTRSPAESSRSATPTNSSACRSSIARNCSPPSKPARAAAPCASSPDRSAGDPVCRADPHSLNPRDRERSANSPEWPGAAERPISLCRPRPLKPVREASGRVGTGPAHGSLGEKPLHAMTLLFFLAVALGILDALPRRSQ